MPRDTSPRPRFQKSWNTEIEGQSSDGQNGGKSPVTWGNNQTSRSVTGKMAVLFMKVLRPNTNQTKHNKYEHTVQEWGQPLQNSYMCAQQQWAAFGTLSK